MMPIEAPISDNESEGDSDESINSIILEDEVDIDIHFHCEHCFKISKCIERIKPGWCCEIITCPHDCGFKFHACKYSEHKLLCANVRVPCINVLNGCPKLILRYQISSHLPMCPASIVVCSAEWNRWALGARERELITPPKEATTHFNPSDLDVVFNLHNQNLVNEMHNYSKNVLELMCNKINKRFPSLPISIKGSVLSNEHGHVQKVQCNENGLTKGCKKSIVNGINTMENHVEDVESSLSLKMKTNHDEYINQCCTHGILRGLCRFCMFDPEDPHFKVGNVWKEGIDFERPGNLKWEVESRVEKIRKKGPYDVFCYKDIDEDEEDYPIESNGNLALLPEGIVGLRNLRFKTPPPSLLSPANLILEMGLKHYSRHQAKPKAMFTFLCLEHVRRDSFCSHYKNVHTEIEEGLDGWIVQRCPLHTIGCPFVVNKLHPGTKNGKIVFCPSLKSFGIKPSSDIDYNFRDHSRSQSVEGVSNSLDRVIMNENSDGVQEPNNFSDLLNLPEELLIMVVRYLDDFSINQLSMTCHHLREICFSVLTDRGLVMQEWVRTVEESGDVKKVHWNLGGNKWFYSKCFNKVRSWRLENEGAISNHLLKCPFNSRNLPENKFRYCPLHRMPPLEAKF